MHDIPALKALLDRHGVRLTRALGQNFLTADWVSAQTAEASGAETGCGVLEVGPGIGALTAQLCRRASKVVSVELDRTLYPVLEETMAAFDNFTLLPGDILQTDIPALVREQFPGLRPIVCANLPYNITTPALTALVEAACFESITVMVQKEAAERILARPGSREAGVFSLFMQYHTAPELLFEVPPDCFFPAPHVTSAVIRCPVYRTPPVAARCGEAFLFTVIRAAFAQRRKTLVNALAAVWHLDKGALEAVLAACGLPKDVRGERLGLEEFAALADALSEVLGEGDRRA